MKRGDQSQAGPDAPEPAWSIIARTYAANRARFLADFEFGWTESLIRVQSLASDRKKAEQLVPEENHELSAEALHANASYMSAALGGASHKEAAGAPVAAALANYVRTINLGAMIPAADMFDARRLQLPPVDVLKGGWDDRANQVLLNPPFLAGMQPQSLNPSPEEKVKLDQGLAHLDGAHERLDGAVAQTRKTTFRRREVANTRNQAAHVVIDAEASALGLFRLIRSLQPMDEVTDQLRTASTAKFSPGQGAEVAKALDVFGTVVPILSAKVDAYASATKTAETAVRQTRFPLKNPLAAVLARAAATNAPEAKKRLDVLRNNDYKLLAAKIRQLAAG